MRLQINMKLKNYTPFETLQQQKLFKKMSPQKNQKIQTIIMRPQINMKLKVTPFKFIFKFPPPQKKNHSF